MDHTLAPVRGRRRHGAGVCVGGCTQGSGDDDSAHVRVVVCRRAGALGSVCARCCGPRWGGRGDPDSHQENKGEGNAASRSQRHATVPPHDCTGMGAGGARGLTGGGPTLFGCRTAQAVLPDGWGQHPTACLCVPPR